MREFTGDKPQPDSKVVALLVRIFKKLLWTFIAWYGIYFFVNIIGMGACTTPQPEPESGRTFHLVASVGRRGSHHCNGYVKPWIGHTYHFMQTSGLILLAIGAVLVVALLIARSITGEWPDPPGTKN